MTSDNVLQFPTPPEFLVTLSLKAATKACYDYCASDKLPEDRAELTSSLRHLGKLLDHLRG